MGFECRCKYIFCNKHRLPFNHNCLNDVKKVEIAYVPVLKKVNSDFENLKNDK